MEEEEPWPFWSLKKSLKYEKISWMIVEMADVLFDRYGFDEEKA